MAISTAYGETPWTTGELALLHGVAGPRAKAKQDALDRLVFEVIAPDYVARNVRADQAAASLAADVQRLARLLRQDEPRTKQHLTRLIRKAYDRAAEDRLVSASKRMPASGRALPVADQPLRRIVG